VYIFLLEKRRGHNSSSSGFSSWRVAEEKEKSDKFLISRLEMRVAEEKEKKR